MKIYIDGIIYSWQKSGGVLRYFNELISGLVNEDKEICVTISEPVISKPPLGMASIKDLSIAKISYPTYLIPYVRKILSPINKIITDNYFKGISDGVFHSTYFTTYANLKIPQILTVYDMTYEKFPNFFSSRGSKRFIKNKKKCIVNADAIICISEATKKCLIEMYNVPENKIFVIYLGVGSNFNTNFDHDIAKELILKYNLDVPFFLFIGNRRLYKNFDFFIKSFAVWNKNLMYNVIVVGGGAFTKDELALFDSLNIRNQIKGVGLVNEEELKTLYCLTKAFVFPSLDEGFGLPILEAICCGSNILASDLDVFKEIAHDWPVYFNPREESSLIRAFDICVNDNKDIFDKSKKIKLIRDVFTWEKCVKKTIDVYTRAYEKNIN